MNPIVTTELDNPPPNTVLIGPDPVQALFTLINARLHSEIQGTYAPYVTGSATPAVNDQDKVWARQDNSGRPIGFYFFFNGNWRRVYSNAIGDIKFFQGDPTDVVNGFDGTGLGIVGGMNDGWALCLSGDSEIELEDGSVKTIREIADNKLGVRVRCYDESSGKFVTAEVDEWFKNEFIETDFVRIRFNKGLQNSGKRSVTATKNHPFLTSMGWKKAGDLVTGDRVLGYEKALTCFGKEALLGMWLGDGSYSFNDGRFTVGHGERQRDYITYIAQQWGVAVREAVARRGYNIGKLALTARIGIKALFPEFTRLVPTRTPHITRSLLSELSTVSLAFWYMDDGSLQTDRRYPSYQRACFHTQGFSEEERTLLADYLLKQWGLQGTYYHSNKRGKPEQKFLRLDEASSARFFGMVAQYILPSMRYKLPELYRGFVCSLKDYKMTERNLVSREVQVREFASLSYPEKRRTDKSARYDIRVSGFHNFIANGFVVHNCNGKNGTKDLSNYFIAGANMDQSGGGSQFDTSSGNWLSYVNQKTVVDHGDEKNSQGQAQAQLQNTDLPTIRVILHGNAEQSNSQSVKKAIVTGNYDPTNPHDQTLGVFGSNPSPISTDPNQAVIPQTNVLTTPRWYAAAICRFVGY